MNLYRSARATESRISPLGTKARKEKTNKKNLLLSDFFSAEWNHATGENGKGVKDAAVTSHMLISLY